jgi:hypothetical protein
MATLLFFMYVLGRIIVTAPILNKSLHEEVVAGARQGHLPADSDSR